jgi:hypothetical protein
MSVEGQQETPGWRKLLPAAPDGYSGIGTGCAGGTGAAGFIETDEG